MKRCLHFLLFGLLAIFLSPSPGVAQLQPADPAAAIKKAVPGNAPVRQLPANAVANTGVTPYTYYTCKITLTGTVTNVACKGAYSGIIKLYVANCYGSVSYLWSDGSTAKDRYSLKAGTYTVTAKDNGLYNCKVTKTFTVQEPATALSVTGAVVHAKQGYTNGSITLTVSGGTPPYSFKWSDGATTQNRTNLGAGTFTVYVKDANGCSVSKSYTVYCYYCKLAISGTTKNPDCYNGSNGSITLANSGAVGSVAYLWSDGVTTRDRNGLKAGTYTVTATDRGIANCSVTKSFTINQPTAINITGTVINVAANGLSNGSINITTSGGTPPYTFRWNDGATTEDRTALAAGTYTVTVTDSRGCTATKGFTVSQPACALTIGTTAQDVTCNGEANGAINVTVGGNAGILSFLWNDGATAQNRTGLPPGNYIVTATDRTTGCAITSPAITIRQPNTLTASGIVVNSQLGQSNGSITLTVTGGTSPYTFLWSDGATTQNRTGLRAGAYSVTVTDHNGCKAMKSFTITEPSCNLSVSGSRLHISCFGGNNGAIELTVSGGTGSFSYQWSDGATGRNRTGLTAGDYTVTVTDQGTLCTATAEFTLYQPSAALNLTGTTVNATNNLANGSIDLTVAGGTPPYSYPWTDGPTTPDRTGLAPGSYTVTVTDANGCKANLSFTIGNNTCGLVINGSSQDANCFGNATGSIVITSVTGATGALSYAWNDGPTTANRSSLPAGNYTVTVTDQSTQCKAIRSFSISQPSALVASGVVVNQTQAGVNNGAINLTVTGGTPSYTYLWNDGITTEGRTGLAPGTYSVTVTDSKGCKATKYFTVQGVTCSLMVNGTTKNANCFGESNGSITLSVTGATGSLSYLWTDGSTAANRTGLAAGTYNVTVTDQATMCKATRSFTISQPATLTVGGTATNITQVGVNNGTITLTVAGGTPPYSFLWNDGVTTQNRSGLAAGIYLVTVTDANGCKAVKSFTITGLSCNLLVSGTLLHVSCFGGNNGAITLSVSGAVGSLTYQWSDGATSQNRTGLTAGNYSVTVTDQSTNCNAVQNFVLFQPTTALSVTGIIVNASNNLNNGSIDVTASGGTSPYTYLWNDGVTSEDRTGLAVGTYTVTVTDANGCKNSKSFTVSGTVCNLVINAYTLDVNCNGNANGSIVITSVTGAAGALYYAWNDGSTAASRSALPAGNYTLTVTDQATQCQAVRTFTINQPPALTLNGVVVNATSGLNNGSIDITAGGGSPPYTFRWNDGVITEDRTGLAPGNYTVTVTDSRGCTAGKTFTVSGPACALGITGVVKNVSCNGNADGTITLTVTGAVGPVTFLWNDGSTLQNRTQLKVGWYQVTAIDQTTKCKVVRSFNIGQPPPLSYTATVTDASVPGASDGSIVSYVGGGTPPYTFRWDDGGTTLNRYNLAAGSYTVTITDSRGCTIAYCVIIRVKSLCNQLSVTGVVTSTCGCNINDGTITLSVSGGTAPYSFKWNDGLTTQNRTGLAAGTYSVTVTDAMGCAKTVSFTVTTAIIYNLTTVNPSDKKGTASGGFDFSAQATPNPTTGRVKLVMYSPVSTTATVRVTDMSGRKMMGSTFNLVKGNNYKDFDLAGASGFYHIEVVAGESRKVVKVLVQR